MGGKGDLTKMTETFTILGLISRDKSKNIKEAIAPLLYQP